MQEALAVLENAKMDKDEGRATPQLPSQWEDHLGSILLAALLVITLANVFVRYFTDQSFAWTEEISSFLMLVLAMAGSAVAIRRDTHMRVEYFFYSGSQRQQNNLTRFSAITNIVFFVLMGALSAQMAWDEFRFGDISPAIGIPKWIYSIWLPIFCAVICVRSVGRLKRVSEGTPKAGGSV